jgi:opacity protein-like surface antigen
MRTSTPWHGGAAAGLLLAAGTAAAEDSGFYTAFNAGISSRPHALSIGLAADTLAREKDHTSDFAWSFAVGYRFNRYFGLEAGFTDLGVASTTLVDAVGGASVARGKISVSARGKTLAALAHRPSGNWDPFLKIGVIDAIVDVRHDARVGDSGLFAFREWEEPRAFAGLGVRYAFHDQWVVSFDVDYYIRITTDRDAGQASVTSPRIGFAYRF